MRAATTLPMTASSLAILSLSTASALTTPGLGINTTTAVHCNRPTQVRDRIAVHYKGTLESTGAEFDESYKRGSPFIFVLGEGRVIQGWDLGLLDMCPGEERTLTIAPELAYGNSGVGAIPPGSTLVFETKLMDIIGVVQEDFQIVTASPSSTTSAAVETEAMFSIATAPPVPGKEDEELGAHAHDDESLKPAVLDEAEDVEADGRPKHNDDHNGSGSLPPQAECHLLGPFALLVQAALGAMALLTLVWKRYCETPKRPWKIFFFDVSKQVLGSMLTHVLNLAMSMLSSVAIVNQLSKTAAMNAEAIKDADGRMPNPCSFYLLNLGIDTTIGIPVLYILLKVVHALALRTPLARPPQSIKSGNYGEPPYHTWWWVKQLIMYFIGLVGMKLFVFFLFSALPWLPWVGDWALRWTKGNEALEVTFAMFIFPLIMNGVQYWIIDNFIMEKKIKGGEDKGDYAVVQGDDDEGGAREYDGDGDESVTEVEQEIVGKDDRLTEVNPTPIPVDGGGRPGSTKSALKDK